MALILWALGLSLLVQGCLSSVGETDKGCVKWEEKGENVGCKACHPGNRLVKEYGPNPKDLCTPCEDGTFTVNSLSFECTRCTQCVGAQVLKKKCTATTDTECDCKEGLQCGDKRCTFCVEKCGKGQEPTEERSCRQCPDGTFNDQSHQKCKPWSKKCTNPGEVIVARADAFTDIKCDNISAITVPNKPVSGRKEDEWPVALFVVPTILMAFIIIIIMIIIAVKCLHNRDEKKKTKKETTKMPIIRTPTDDPRTLIAIECSFHEAQQEQGSSSESLASKDSSDPLIP